MRVFCSGFNLYGQFISCRGILAEAFIDCQYEEITNLDLSHTFSVVLANDDVFLHGAKNGETHAVRKVLLPEAVRIAQTSCSGNRILFLSDNGALFKLELDERDDLALVPLPALLHDAHDETRKDHFTKITCGSKISVALTQQGKLFNLPNKLNFEDKNIADIRAGCEHCLLLDSEGNVYSFGRGSRGQLGHGNLDDEPEPKLVQGLAGIKISQIAAGGWHSCAVSAEGDLYSWGWNGNGQLGLSKTGDKAVSVMASPHVVDFKEPDEEVCLDITVAKVACGNRHTVAFLDNGKLFGAGWNKYHQLGNAGLPKENVYTMTFLRAFSGLNVADLKCGPWSTAVIIS